MPAVGGRVIVNFLGTSVPGTVSAVLEEGRRLEVATDEGETIAFALNRATATFTAEGEQTGARLTFVNPSGPGFGPRPPGRAD
jgi:hypothetical protein